jgi:arylsulfatase A-like enzyme
MVGFNRSYGSLAGGVGQYNHLYKKGPYSRTWHRNDRLVDEKGHSTDLIAREAVRWIEAKREPFFIYVAFTAVHVPVEVPPRYMELYEGKKFYDDPVKDESFKFYAAYATHMDDAIGRMVEALERTGMRENTLIVFASDNGSIPRWRPRGSYPGTYKACPVLGSNLPLRGLKAQLYEGGIRVPTIVNWPGKLAPRKVDSPVHVVDWMPTLTRLAGYKSKEDLKWDGRNIWPLLTGQVTPPEPRTLYWRFTRGRSAIRHGDWKLIVDQVQKSVELYNLAVDPYEKHDLAGERPEQVDRLQALLAEQRKLDKRET